MKTLLLRFAMLCASTGASLALSAGVASALDCSNQVLCVVNLNIAGGVEPIAASPDKVLPLANRVATIKNSGQAYPDIITAQEVCYSQFAEFEDQSKFPGYHAEFFERFAHGTQTAIQCPNGHIGQVVAVRSQNTPTVERYELPSESPTVRKYSLGCVLFDPPGAKKTLMRACTTHLTPGGYEVPEGSTAMRWSQTSRIKSIVAGWGTSSRSMIAGDFNLNPQDNPMNNMYQFTKNGGQAPNGGIFNELTQTQCPSGVTPPCRLANKPTSWQRKIDYVFMSKNSSYGKKIGEMTMNTVDTRWVDTRRSSNHRMMIGKAKWKS